MGSTDGVTEELKLMTGRSGRSLGLRDLLVCNITLFSVALMGYSISFFYDGVASCVN